MHIPASKAPPTGRAFYYGEGVSGMTEEQIRQIVREEIAAHEERLIEATKLSLNQDLKNLLKHFQQPDGTSE